MVLPFFASLRDPPPISVSVLMWLPTFVHPPLPRCEIMAIEVHFQVSVGSLIIHLDIAGRRETPIPDGSRSPDKCIRWRAGNLVLRSDDGRRFVEDIEIDPPAEDS